MLTVGTIRWFRERPLALFCRVAVVAGAVGTIFIAATIVAVVYFWPYKAHSLVFPGVATTSFGLSFYLLMLGLIGETVLYGNRQTTNRPGEPPAVGGTS